MFKVKIRVAGRLWRVGAGRHPARGRPTPFASSGGCSYLCVIPTLFPGGSRSPPGRGLGITAEALCLGSSEIDDLSFPQLEPLELGAGELRPDLGAVTKHELDPDLEAEGDDPLDHPPPGVLVGLPHRPPAAPCEQDAAHP